jgi:YVTN family beta-propeller protein
MKKFLYSSVFLLMLFACVDCRRRENPEPIYSNGVLILNEGNFSQANGNISFYKSATQSVTSDIVKVENNGVGINATIQKVFDDVANQKLYVVTNSPDKLLVFNRITFKNERTISTGLTNPFAVVIANGKAFVSEWGTTDFVTYPNAKIQVVDLATNQITSSIPVGKEVNGMLEYGGKIYAAVTGENKVWVINSVTNQVETTIATSAKPAAMEVDANGKIWVLCSSGKLDRINPFTNVVETTISNVSVVGYGSSEKITMDNARTTLYWIGQSSAGFTNQGIFRISTSATTAPTTPFIVGTQFYGLGVSPTNNQIVLGVTDFGQTQEVHFYNTSGVFGSKVNSGGINANGFLFR